MRFRKKEIETELVYFRTYGDFRYRVNGYFYVTVQEIDKRETTVLLHQHDHCHAVVCIAQPAFQVFREIEPEEFVRLGGNFWESELECHSTHHFLCVEHFLEFLH